MRTPPAGPPRLFQFGAQPVQTATAGGSFLPPGGPPSWAERQPASITGRTAEPTPDVRKQHFSGIAGQQCRHRSGAAVEPEQPFEAPGDKLDRAFQTDVIFRSGVPRLWCTEAEEHGFLPW